MKKTIIVAALLLFGLATLESCSSLHVNSDYDHNVAFWQYKTFAWMPPTRAPAATTLSEVQTLTERRAHGAIDSELRNRGLQPAPQGQTPDLYVVFDTFTLDRFSASSWSGTGYGYGYSHRSWFTYGSPAVWNHEFEGALQIALIDAKTKQTVWQGIARDETDGGLMDQKTVDKAVRELLAEYPPKSER